MKPISICVIGPNGRMGKQIIAAVQSDARFALAGTLSRASLANDKQNISKSDLVIEFTRAESTGDWAKLCAEYKKPLVSGTTGLSDAQFTSLREVAKTIPIFHANNMSKGVFVAQQLVAQASRLLGAGYAVEIIETHHAKKVDAPSGTALNLAKAAADARGLDKSKYIYGREGQTGARPADQIAIHALRGGDVIGEHHVHFLGSYERLEITHRALNRELFARGALDAAHWLLKQKPSLYGMADLLA
ncbi:MAG: 4-hydroxy-tetrahydrodipicolinate reductase [Alphaproteobacteria bacterium]|nr:MAG: 4-hydroxy-tetrahydrodipicolinate reductase [Alphaproteobacteria bacterium]